MTVEDVSKEFGYHKTYLSASKVNCPERYKFILSLGNGESEAAQIRSGMLKYYDLYRLAQEAFLERVYEREERGITLNETGRFLRDKGHYKHENMIYTDVRLCSQLPADLDKPWKFMVYSRYLKLLKLEEELKDDS